MRRLTVYKSCLIWISLLILCICWILCKLAGVKSATNPNNQLHRLCISDLSDIEDRFDASRLPLLISGKIKRKMVSFWNVHLVETGCDVCVGTDVREKCHANRVFLRLQASGHVWSFQDKPSLNMWNKEEKSSLQSVFESNYELEGSVRVRNLRNPFHDCTRFCHDILQKEN